MDVVNLQLGPWIDGITAPRTLRSVGALDRQFTGQEFQNRHSIPGYTRKS